MKPKTGKEKTPGRAGPDGTAGPGPLGGLGEFGLIRELVRELGDSASDILLPEGDDAALWRTRGPVLATTDAMVEGVHYRAEWTSPEDLGFKVISVNVSDIAAMGGAPALALVALGVKRSDDPAWFAGVYRGFAEACRLYGLKIGGGDTFASRDTAFVVTVLGTPPEPGAVGRSGASEGDLLFVTGELGEAAAGLAYLKARQLEGRSKGKTRKANRGAKAGAMAGAVARFTRPEARLAEGMAAAGVGATAMIDISDGLAPDALHLASAGGVGVRLVKAMLPLGRGAMTAESALGEVPELLALSGGEDYELLISIPPGRAEDLAAAIRPTGTKLTQVGEVVSRDSGCVLEDGASVVELAVLGGFDHFKER